MERTVIKWYNCTVESNIYYSDIIRLGSDLLYNVMISVAKYASVAVPIINVIIHPTTDVYFPFSNTLKLGN